MMYVHFDELETIAQSGEHDCRFSVQIQADRPFILLTWLRMTDVFCQEIQRSDTEIAKPSGEIQLLVGMLAAIASGIRAGIDYHEIDPTPISSH